MDKPSIHDFDQAPGIGLFNRVYNDIYDKDGNLIAIDVKNKDRRIHCFYVNDEDDCPGFLVSKYKLSKEAVQTFLEAKEAIKKARFELDMVVYHQEKD